MKYKAININFPKVSAVGIGHIGAESLEKRKHIPYWASVRALEFAFDCGINFIDTAENYGDGMSEKIIGTAIKNIGRDKLYISTKVSPENLNYDSVIESCDNSLKRLNIDVIDIYQIHWPNPEVEFEETFAALNKLVQQGKIENIGVSNFSRHLYEKAKEHSKISSVQIEYNLVDSYQKYDLPTYLHDDAIIIGYSPLYYPKDYIKMNILETIARKYGATKEQIMLNWISGANENLIPIFKSENVKHIRSNSEALDFEIDKFDKELLDINFDQQHKFIKMKDIKITPYGRENREFYQTIDEAIENRFNLYPSPKMLADSMVKNKNNAHFQKPIKVIAEDTDQQEYKYRLHEGRVRFWANMIYHNGNTEELISAIIT